MTRSIQSINEVQNNARLCAEQGDSVHVADDLELDVRDIWLEAYAQWHLDNANKVQA